MTQIKELHQEIEDIEREAFKSFCSKLKIKSIQHYEAKSNMGHMSSVEDAGSNIFDQKRDLE
jgi:hypothetical protein